VKSAGLTNPGRVRKKNQDSFSLDPGNKIFIVADGMGGHFGGEIASQTTVKVINEYYLENFDNPVEKIITEAINKANNQIFKLRKNMGTTLELIIIKDLKAFIGHVGDSRIYRIRNNKLEILTNDHTRIKELMDSGQLTPEEASLYPFQHVITRAVGIEVEVNIDIFSTDIQADDIFIMCSDGLTGDMAKSIVTDEELIKVCGGSDEPEDWCQKFIDIANEKGGPDNITVVIIKIEEEDLK
jgi:protein phosphatase